MSATGCSARQCRIGGGGLGALSDTFADSADAGEVRGNAATTREDRRRARELGGARAIRLTAVQTGQGQLRPGARSSGALLFLRRTASGFGDVLLLHAIDVELRG